MTCTICGQTIHRTVDWVGHSGGQAHAHHFTAESWMPEGYDVPFAIAPHVLRDDMVMDIA